MTSMVRVINSGVLVGELVRVADTVAVAGRTDVLVARRVPVAVRVAVEEGVNDGVNVCVG